MFRYPRILRFALPLLAVYLLIGSLYRIGLWLYFDSASQPLTGELVAKALTLGLRFDLRVGLFMLLPVLLLGWISWINPLACKNNCPACGRNCPTSAIIFPRLKESGTLAGAEPGNEPQVQVLPSNNLISTLNQRSALRRNIFRNGLIELAEAERAKALEELKDNNANKLNNENIQ